MTMGLENSNAGTQRTRRNIMKMGAILASSAVAGAYSAHAATSTTTAACAVVRCNCFLKETKIRTADGERKIEDLAIGDLLPTMFGRAASDPVDRLLFVQEKRSVQAVGEGGAAGSDRLLRSRSRRSTFRSLRYGRPQPVD